ASTGTDAPVDAAPEIDAPQCAVPAAGAIGGTCAIADECTAPKGAFALCLNNVLAGPFKWPAEGFCTFSCTDSADCGDGNFCADIGGATFCMPSCCAEVGRGASCSAGRLCSDSLYGIIDMGGEACVPGNVEAIDGDSCDEFFDCNIGSDCRRDSFEAPNGYCLTQGCTLGDNTTCAPGGDGNCVDLFELGTPVCVDSCLEDSECQQSVGFRCVETPGIAGRYCAHPEVGDSCLVPSNCGNSPPWGCRTGADYPDGYCTINQCTMGSLSSCSLTSRCFDPDTGTVGDEYCAARCDPEVAASCRTGYICATVEVGTPDTPEMADLCIPDAQAPPAPISPGPLSPSVRARALPPAAADGRLPWWLSRPGL
ncbi:MAG: hypothetical protein AAGC55_12225, partial [Myxococcota bacterium]